MDKKKITAAISAVINYIQEEEAAIYLHSLTAAASEASITATVAQENFTVQPEETEYPTMPLPLPVPQATAGLWAASGRQSQMQLRNLMQLRAFNRI